jgi:hypothetical protein
VNPLRQRPSVFWTEIASIVVAGIAIADDSTRGLVAAFALAWLALILDQSHKKDAYEQLAATHRRVLAILDEDSQQ